ncbi:DUF7342 family protein [Haloprofundus halobius]|uniref:DUF7342 family protein n=1 Tax=Haloprofundus halobius TaxID=2876194 RepID=UPI001CCE491E|nr:ArsR family transcriptional regulator [Haloprofundus halobius]
MTHSDPGVDAWKEHTSAFDRVRSVAQTVSEPRSVSWIAEKAAVSENTARGHLRRLVEMNVLLTFDRDGRTTYAPDPLHTRHQTLRELLDEYDHEGLIALKESLQTQIETWRGEYGVAAPEELRTLAADTETAEETATVRRTANDWALTEYRLSIVEEAIDNYTTYSRRGTASA